jgi:hypothetical protein
VGKVPDPGVCASCAATSSGLCCGSVCYTKGQTLACAHGGVTLTKEHMSVMPALVRLKQEDHKFKASLDCMSVYCLNKSHKSEVLSVPSLIDTW